MKPRYILLILSLLSPWGTACVMAQSNGSNSSYSRYGLGTLSEQSNGYNRSMGGVSQALRSGNRINFLNPASYSSVDSLSFLFDVGMSLQRTRFLQEGNHKGVNNTQFDYVAAGFRVRRGLGMSVGFMPYTKIGYTFSKEANVGQELTTGEQITSPAVFSGEGGLHEAFIGAGWEPFKGLSIGANVGLLWGNINHQIAMSFAQNSTVTTTDGGIITYYEASLMTWRVNAGLQYQTLINSTNRITFGGTVGIGHKIHRDAMYISSTNGLTADTLTATNPFELPMTYSFGVAWEHAERILLAADAHYEQWGSCSAPVFNQREKTYLPSTDVYKNRLRFNIGVEYVPGRYDRAYQRRVNYRFGAFYSSPNLIINGLEGPKDFGLTAGVGLPITNQINNRSYVNVGLQWTHRSASASSLITENIMQINIGLTFNERWFMKWKFN